MSCTMAIILRHKNNKHIHKAIKLQEKKKSKKLLNEIGEIVDYSNFL